MIKLNHNSSRVKIFKMTKHLQSRRLPHCEIELIVNLELMLSSNWFKFILTVHILFPNSFKLASVMILRQPDWNRNKTDNGYELQLQFYHIKYFVMTLCNTLKHVCHLTIYLPLQNTLVKVKGYLTTPDGCLRQIFFALFSFSEDTW